MTFNPFEGNRFHPFISPKTISKTPIFAKSPRSRMIKLHPILRCRLPGNTEAAGMVKKLNSKAPLGKPGALAAMMKHALGRGDL